MTIKIEATHYGIGDNFTDTVLIFYGNLRE